MDPNAVSAGASERDLEWGTKVLKEKRFYTSSFNTRGVFYVVGNVFG